MTTVVECIDTNDMETVLGILSPKSPSHELKKRVEEATRGNSPDNFGMIDYEEFRAWISKTDVYLIFKTFDKDGNGFIDVAEMEMIFHALDPSWTSDKVQTVLQEAALNGDGKIDYEQFLTWAFKQARERKDNGEEEYLQNPVAKKEIDTQALQMNAEGNKENAKNQGYAATGGEEIDLLRYGSPGAVADDTDPKTPIRSSSRELDFGGALTDAPELANRLNELNPAMTLDKAKQLVENAQRSLVVFPAI